MKLLLCLIGFALLGGCSHSAPASDNKPPAAVVAPTAIVPSVKLGPIDDPNTIDEVTALHGSERSRYVEQAQRAVRARVPNAQFLDGEGVLVNRADLLDRTSRILVDGILVADGARKKYELTLALNGDCIQMRFNGTARMPPYVTDDDRKP